MRARSIPGGLLIVFEGIDGVGKTTQLKLVKDLLESEGWPVKITRNLGGTPIGEKLREVMKAPTPRPSITNLYISVAIQEALVQAMAQERENSGIILMDRGPISLAAYEIFGSGLDESLGWQHVDNGMSELSPELTIIYTADVKTALDRARDQSKSVDYFESKPLSYFYDVANGYEQAAKRYAQSIVTIDANQPIDKVHEQSIAIIRDAIRAKLA